MSYMRPCCGWAAIVAVLMQSACTSGSRDYFGTVTPHHPADELWVNNGSEPEYIDPGKCSESQGGSVILNLFAGLAQAHPQTLQPLPDIAQSWDVAADKRTYTFHLRHTVWSDGTPLTAEDFAWSWRRILDPATASRYASMLHVIKNGQAYNEKALWVRAPPANLTADDVQHLFGALGTVARVDSLSAPDGFVVFFGGDDADKDAFTQRGLALDHTLWQDQPLHVQLADASLLGLQTPDAYTLVVQLTAPVPYFLDLVAYHTFMPVPRHLLSRLRAQGRNEDLWTRPEFIVSNGAYVLQEWHFKDHFVYAKNLLYWDAAHVRLRRVKVLEVESANTTLNLYRTGDLDWLGPNTPLPGEFLAHLQSYKDYHRDANLSVYFYWFNTRVPPTDNLKVRQALSLAIDRAALVRDVARGGQIASADLVPDKLAGYHGLHRPLFDPNRARQLLTEAGFGPDHPVPPVTLIYNTAEGHKQLAEAVQDMWHTHLGIDASIENQEWKVFLKNLEMRNFQIARLGWVGDYPDPTTFLHDLLTAHAGNNPSGWESAHYDALLDKANLAADANTRLAMLREAEALALDAQPMIPLYVYTRSYMLKPYVKGFWGNYEDRHPLKYLFIDDAAVAAAR